MKLPGRAVVRAFRSGWILLILALGIAVGLRLAGFLGGGRGAPGRGGRGSRRQAAESPAPAFAVTIAGSRFVLGSVDEGVTPATVVAEARRRHVSCVAIHLRADSRQLALDELTRALQAARLEYRVEEPPAPAAAPE